MCNLTEIANSEHENRSFSAFYSNRLDRLVKEMLGDGGITVGRVLESAVVRRYLVGESIKGKSNTQLQEESLGQSIEEYHSKFKELRVLGKGGMSKVMLVERVSDKALFAAKIQKDKTRFTNAREEFLML